MNSFHLPGGMDAETSGQTQLPSLDVTAAAGEVGSKMLSVPKSPLQTTGQRTPPTRSTSRQSSNGSRPHSEVTTDSSSSASSIPGNGDDSNGFLQPFDGIDRGSSADEDAHSLPSSRDEVEPLEHRIRERMITSAGSHEKFLPICDLEEIITLENIKGELTRSGRVIADLDFIAQQVLEPPSGQATSRRKIFAILCLLRKARRIQAFIEQGCFDCHLPFGFGVQDSNSSNEGFNPPPELFKSWKNHNIDMFERYQGQILAPYFSLSNENRLGFHEQKFHHSVVLPFVEYEVKPDRILGKTVQGGFSEVRIVKIHCSHHDYVSPDSEEDVYFAVKQLQRYDHTSVGSEQQRTQEIQAYKRLNHMQHPHLTRLLATYTYRKHIHLVFPYATGDLHNFWFDHFSKPTEPKRDHKFVRWMSKQLVGLAQALYKIHHCDVHEFVSKHSSIDVAKTHGRHGDLKPENILWFRHESNGSEDDILGVLKISDFGFAEFHSPNSLSVETSGVGFTPTYKAPEFDMDRMSPKYDIWSFGCILLQFVVWYLHGWIGVEEFSRKRMEESNRLDHPDDFFNFYRTDGEILVTEAKQSVRQEIASIKEHPASSDFILDLVDLIESMLLRLTAENRATSDEIKQKLEQLDVNCRDSIAYCTKKRKTITKTTTDLSDRVELNVSAKMRREIIGIIDPASPKLPQVNEWLERGHSTDEENAPATKAPEEFPTSPELIPRSPGTVPQRESPDQTVSGDGLGIFAASNEASNLTGSDIFINASGGMAVQNTKETSKGMSKDTPKKINDEAQRHKRFRMWMRRLLGCFV